MSWSTIASSSIAKHSQIQPISYQSPSAGSTVVNSRQWRYQATTSQTVTKTDKPRPAARDRQQRAQDVDGADDKDRRRKQFAAM